jgi:hypothetical protein
VDSVFSVGDCVNSEKVNSVFSVGDSVNSEKVNSVFSALLYLRNKYKSCNKFTLYLAKLPKCPIFVTIQFASNLPHSKSIFSAKIFVPLTSGNLPHFVPFHYDVWEQIKSNLQAK